MKQPEDCRKCGEGFSLKNGSWEHYCCYNGGFHEVNNTPESMETWARYQLEIYGPRDQSMKLARKERAIMAMLKAIHYSRKAKKYQVIAYSQLNVNELKNQPGPGSSVIAQKPLEAQGIVFEDDEYVTKILKWKDLEISLHGYPDGKTMTEVVSAFIKEFEL